MLIKGTIDGGKVIFAVEGKVNESFGNDNLRDYFFKAKVDKLNGRNTKKCDRVEELLSVLFGNKIPKHIGRIKNQFITALSGTLKEAKIQDVNKAFLIVQVFNTLRTDAKSIIRNHRDLNKLISILDSSDKGINENQVLGPFIFEEYQDIELFIGFIS